MMELINNFHFLRPEWLLLLIPALLAGLWLQRRSRQSGNWDRVISPELLPWLVEGAEKAARPVWLWLAIWSLGALAMAGPSWQKIPLPVHKTLTPVVVIFDLSPSMLAEDLVPNRLARARLKLIDFLNQRQEGTTALISYSGEAFTVSPLTDDANTIAAMVPALHPSIMPIIGSQVEDAVALAIELVKNTGQQGAELLIITDGIDHAGSQALQKALRAEPEFDVSILGAGTTDGSPIPLPNGGFAKDRNGSIVIPKLPDRQLAKLAALHEGRYTTLTADNSDLDYLNQGFTLTEDAIETLDERTADSWHDTGYLITLALLPLLLLMFRRGVVASLLLTPLVMGMLPQQAQAFGWVDLWQTPDQQGAEAIQSGDPEQAQQLFNNPHWKASAAYQNGDFQAAEELFSQGQDTRSHYNLGNALARQGKLEEAIEAYQQALQQQPDMEDAQANKALLEELLKQQQQQDTNQNSQENNFQGQQEQQQNQQQDSSESGDSQQQPEQSSQANNQAGEQSNDQSQGDPEASDQQQQNGDPNQQQASQSQPQEQPESSADQQQAQTGQQEQEQAQDADQQQQLAPMPEAGELSDEDQQKMAQWLRKIPDDPSGLLRKKFLYESRQRAMEQSGGRLPPAEQQRW